MRGILLSSATKWNPEGTLARWEESAERYDWVYLYDKENRLMQIARDYRNGSSHLRLESRYNADGFKVWEREWFEMRVGWRAMAVCGIGCGSLPIGSGSVCDGGRRNRLEVS